MGYKETRTIITYKKIKQTADCCIIESSSENLDCPSADTFRVLTSSMVFGTPKAKDKCMLVWYCLVDFHKFSFLKVIIKTTTESAVTKQF